MNGRTRATAHAVLAVLAFAASLVAAPARVSACSCVAGYSAREYMDGADAVFLGMVERARLAGRDRHTATFLVQRQWKGSAAGTIDVSAGRYSPSCGVEFPTGKVLLIYAHTNDDGLATTHCSGNKPLAAAATDLAELGEGYPPSPGIPRLGSNDRSGERAPSGAAVAGIAALAAVAAWLTVRRARRQRNGPLDG
jgi:hypothetical protein